ncbi:hypothetical protein P5673_028632 [Acropora cervicornis]|uniref:Uncharacterized protein n=1 Tax=Acropora cervicornis TaxID=6130 RepID=A0AAD9UUS6_ACRCE|nr:hypothetical protein P5673_028632 [Acropora cervicornis]
MIQCKEAMKSMHFLSDLASTKFLKLVSLKLPSYSDIVKFVETEAKLATEPVFSPVAVKEKWKKGPNKSKIFTHWRQPPNVKSSTTSTSHFQRKNSPASEPKSSSRMCPVC